jgi:signal transduction histidine kinase
LSDDDLSRVESRSTVVTLSEGEELFSEGDQGDSAFVIVDGEIEIVKRTGEREVLLAVRSKGEVIGEMALLQNAPRSATARARSAGELVSIPKAEIDSLMDTSVEAVRALFRVILDRWQSTQAMLTQSERMAQLGTLTAGLAHELNNPAAAVNRAAGQLGDAIDALISTERTLLEAISNDERSAVTDIRTRLEVERESASRLDALEQADLEAEVEDQLTDAGIDDGWRLAPSIVEAGLAGEVEPVIEQVGKHSGALFEVVHANHDVRSLLHQVEEGTRRLSAIVKALKSYSYLDQAPVQDVDLTVGIDDTLLILGSKLRDIDVRTTYADDLPTIQAYGSELNQVWTNLLDNAADAIHESGRPDGSIDVRAFSDGNEVVVEVIDNGPGIPPSAINRVFDSFFTTKPPGSGTGLGLNITYAIVVHKHRGDITVISEPGNTVFRVELPRHVAN